MSNIFQNIPGSIVSSHSHPLISTQGMVFQPVSPGDSSYTIRFVDNCEVGSESITINGYAITFNIDAGETTTDDIAALVNAPGQTILYGKECTAYRVSIPSVRYTVNCWFQYPPNVLNHGKINTLNFIDSSSIYTNPVSDGTCFAEETPGNVGGNAGARYFAKARGVLGSSSNYVYFLINSDNQASIVDTSGFGFDLFGGGASDWVIQIGETITDPYVQQANSIHTETNLFFPIGMDSGASPDDNFASSTKISSLVNLISYTAGTVSAASAIAFT